MISLILARSKNNVIGNAGNLPWHLGADLRQFKRITTGHSVIMGRKTFEAMGRPLPDRHNIVVTRNPLYKAAGVTVTHTLHAAIDMAKDQAGADEIFIIGGAELFREALKLGLCDRIYLTEVEAEVEGDVKVDLDLTGYKSELLLAQSADEKNDFAFKTYLYERVAPSTR